MLKIKNGVDPNVFEDHGFRITTRYIKPSIVFYYVLKSDSDNTIASICLRDKILKTKNKGLVKKLMAAGLIEEVEAND